MVSAPLNLTPFYLAPLQKKYINLSAPPLKIMSNPPQNFGGLDSPLEICSCPKKAKTHFLKKQKILFPTMK